MRHLLVAVLAWLCAARAHAYLIDANDARVVAPGTVELELQPVGYLQTLVGAEEHYLLAPSVQAYAGLAEGWDMLFLTRGYVRLDDDPEQSPYALAGQFLAFRRMIAHGRYDLEEGEGPSLALQMGVALPGIEAETGLGASVALLFAWQGDPGTLHLNAWATYTQDETWDGFFSAVVEGPPDWPVRPAVEVWFDVDGGEPALSGLVGAVGDIGQAFSLQAGARVGGWDGYLEFEVRLSSWASWDVFPPREGHGASESREARRSARPAGAPARR